MTYDDVFTFENLFQAHLRARRSKRGKKDVILFELNLSANLWDLYRKLNDRTYTISGYHSFYIHEPKEREIQALEYKDRVVQHALCDLYLYPLLTRKLIYDNGACQKGKGTDFALDRLTKFFRDSYREYGGNTGYILKADIRKFFPSIDHDRLKEKLRRAVDEQDIMTLLEKIVDSFNGDFGKGIPMGNQTSQLFALYYLDALDRFCKEQKRVKYYVRYMDDIVVIGRTKEELKSLLGEMADVVRADKLEFNEKTQIFPVKNGVEFLGFHFYQTETGKVIRKLRTSSKKRFKRRLRLIKCLYQKGEIDLDSVKRSLAGYFGHIRRGDTYDLLRHSLKSFVLNRPEMEENGDLEEIPDKTVSDMAADFGLRIVNLHNYLRKDKEYIFSKKLLECGVEAGALLTRAAYLADEVSLASYITEALDRLIETAYWLKLTHKAGLIDRKQYDSINGDCEALIIQMKRILAEGDHTDENHQ